MLEFCAKNQETPIHLMRLKMTVKKVVKPLKKCTCTIECTLIEIAIYVTISIM